MSSTKEVTVFSSFFAEALLLMFIAFKLLGVIDWSWFWVLSPLWIPLAIIAAILLLIALFFVLGKVNAQRSV